MCLDTPGDHPDPFRVEASQPTFGRSGFGGNQDQAGMATGQFGPPSEEPVAVAGDQRWIGEEGEVVDGHDQRGLARRDRHGGGMDDVDRSGGPFHRWPSERVPGLVERQTGQRQVTHLDPRLEGANWRTVVTGGHPHHVHVVSEAQGGHGAQDGRGGAPGNPVPALLEGDGHAPSSFHDPILTGTGHWR